MRLSQILFLISVPLMASPWMLGSEKQDEVLGSKQLANLFSWGTVSLYWVAVLGVLLLCIAVHVMRQEQRS